MAEKYSVKESASYYSIRERQDDGSERMYCSIPFGNNRYNQMRRIDLRNRATNIALVLNATVIAYHGTDKESAELILKQGFKKKSYFAFKKEEAMNYGDHIFTVVLSANPDRWKGEPVGDELWQFHLRNDIGREVIYKMEVMTGGGDD